MNVPGLSDSVDGIGEHAEPCTSCGGTARLVNGICLACLLHEGLEPEAPHDDESLQSLLARIDVSDCEWRIGNYDILGEIGRGGMGVIYKARHRESRRIVALKRVLSYHSDSTETLIRFRREAEAAASLDHPNILPIYEVGEAEGVPFFTMKFAPGGSLQQAKHVLRDDPRHCVALLARVSRAVHHAHSQGILHRDLKPGNILLDSWREPMVTDFGLAKWLDASSDLTRTLTIFGTPGYIAPEQARGGTHATLGPTADVYSLGAILFDLLAGRPPFLGEHALAVIHEAAEKPAPRLRAVLPSADHDLETICAKCLEREPHARYHSAADLAEDLECWLEGRAIAARPVSLPQHVWRWALRNRVLAGSLTACVFLAAGALTSYMTSSRLAATMRGAELAQRSVTLVPIEDLSEDASGAPGAAALQNEVATALGGTAGINFRPLSQMPRDADPWSADDWRAIGHATGARFALSGSVREREANYDSPVDLSIRPAGTLSPHGWTISPGSGRRRRE
jgi:serine/threonine-protein kinase